MDKILRYEDIAAQPIDSIVTLCLSLQIRNVELR